MQVSQLPYKGQANSGAPHCIFSFIKFGFHVDQVRRRNATALVKDFQVTVADGNGLQLEAQSSGDVLEAGIEVLEWQDSEPQPDGDGGSQADADGGSQTDADGGSQTDADGGPQADGDIGADPGDNNLADANHDAGTGTDEETIVSGGCAGCSSTSAGRGYLVLLLGLGMLIIRRNYCA